MNLNEDKRQDSSKNIYEISMLQWTSFFVFGRIYLDNQSHPWLTDPITVCEHTQYEKPVNKLAGIFYTRQVLELLG